MNKLALVLVVLAAACGEEKPSQQAAFTAFGAATASAAQAQSRALSAASSLVAPEARNLDYEGPCATGGTARVTGSYDGDGGQAATFDLQVEFNGCNDGQGTLDGSLAWSSSVDGSNYSASMTGDLAFVGPQGSADCDYDLHVAVMGQAVSYSGSVCGYNVGTGQ